jgi:hypothetical protein
MRVERKVRKSVPITAPAVGDPRATQPGAPDKFLVETMIVAPPIQGSCQNSRLFGQEKRLFGQKLRENW